MLFQSLAALTLGSSALAISITGPSPSAYWVQNVTNVIKWTFESSDPNPVDVIVTNSNQATLNGAFSIQRAVDLTNGSFVVSNVTLTAGTGYKVNLVNGTDPSQVFASSQEFEVKQAGTPISSDSAAQPSSSAAGSSGASGSGSATATGAAASGSAPAPNSASQLSELVPVWATAGLVVISGLAALF